MKRTRMLGQLFAGVALSCVLSPAFSAVFSAGPGSSIDLSGTIAITVEAFSTVLSSGSGSLVEQGPGSLHSNLSGLINANVSASDVSFPGGNALNALPSGNWQPSGSPAAFGFQVEIPLSGVLAGNSVKFVGDIRDLSFFLTGTKPLSGPPGNQTFDTAGLELNTDGGTMDLQIFRCVTGTCTLVDTLTFPPDNSGPPDVLPAGTGTLTGAGNTLTLSLPIQLEATVSDSQPLVVQGITATVGVTADIALDGNVVASAVPEPSAWAMLCVGLAGIGLMWRRMRVT